MVPALAALAAAALGPVLHHVAVATGDDLPLAISDARCRRCGERLDSLLAACRTCGLSNRRMWLVAAVAAVVALGVASSVGVRWTLAAYMWMVAMTVVLLVTDIDHKRIPNRITYPGTPAGVLLLAAGAVADGTAERLLPALLGGLVYSGVLLVVFLAARGGFGFGDVKLAVPLGVFLVFLGWDRLLVAAFATALLGGIVAAVALVTGSGAKSEIPYGPPMIVGAWIAIVGGSMLTRLLL